MAIISVSSLNTTGVNLISNNTLIVTTLGTLFTEAIDAVLGTGDLTMTILGAVASGEADGIDVSTGNIVRINIGAAGFVGSTNDTAIEIDATNVFLRNAGTVQGLTNAIWYTSPVAPNASVQVDNTGTLDGGVLAIFVAGQGGTFQLINTGTITGHAGAVEVLDAARMRIMNSGVIGDPGSAVFDQDTLQLSGGIILWNSGTIFGPIDATAGLMNLTNSGLIDGTVTGGSDIDFFDLRGGLVTGRVSGGDASDTYVVSDTLHSIFDGGSTGTDVIFASVSYSLSGGGIEILQLQGAAAVEGYGDMVANQIFGTEVNNRIFGYGGNDILGSFAFNAIAAGGDDLLSGGGGNDLMRLAPEGSCTVRGGGGFDTVAFFTDTGTDVRIDLIGGIATASGASDDVHKLFSVESVQCGAGNDTVLGRAVDEVIGGGQGKDVLNGGGGADSLNGDAGTDRLTGGAQNDRFIFLTGESGVGVGLRDVITDFTLGDIIDLSAIDAIAAVAGNDAFIFVGTATLAGGSGRLRFEQIAGQNITLVEADTDGNGAANLQIELTGLVTLTAASFVL